MEILTTKPDRTVASLIHISTFSKYLLPFGNFILPLILWSAKKNDPFVNEHGKQALNFQISIFLYFVLLVCTGISGVITAMVTPFDEDGAHELLDRLFGLHGLERAIRDALMPYLRELGERWARKQVSIAQEHFASRGLFQPCELRTLANAGP